MKAFWIVLGLALTLEVLGIMVVAGLHLSGVMPVWEVRTTDRNSQKAHDWYVIGGFLSWSLMRMEFLFVALTLKKLSPLFALV